VGLVVVIGLPYLIVGSLNYAEELFSKRLPEWALLLFNMVSLNPPSSPNVVEKGINLADVVLVGGGC
jgi:hypothetical protein